MKICLVTSFPPSHGGLSEYGLHIARELQSNPFVSLTILADIIPSPADELAGFSVVRCWSPDRPAETMRLLKEIRKIDPEVVWFNLLFSTFGTKPLNAFAGLMLPVLTRLSGRYTHVTLHHLMDTVDLKDLGVRFPSAYRLAGAVATRMLLLANSISVLMPRYREILLDRYGSDNVHLRAHGILTRRPQYPDFSRRGRPIHRILAFGKWGTYKRLELMIEAFDLIAAQLPNARLVIAGADHPQTPGYIEAIRNEHAASPRIEFTGYIEEDRLAEVFQSSSVAVMPYSSSTGCSGVAHLASAYGVPIVCADLEDFQQMAYAEDLAIEFYRPGDAQSLADCLIHLLQRPERLQAMAEQNFSAALRMTMPNVVQKYLRHFEVQQRLETLRQVSRFRRLPKWLPSRSLLLRAITRTSNNWVDHSGVFRLWNHTLGNSHGDDRGELPQRGVPIDGDRVAGRTLRRLGGGASATRSRKQTDSDETGNPGNSEKLSPPSCAGEGETENAGRKQQSGILRFLYSSIRPGGRGHNGNGKSGTGSSTVRSNADGREGANQNAGDVATRQRDGNAKGSSLRDRGNREPS